MPRTLAPRPVERDLPHAHADARWPAITGGLILGLGLGGFADGILFHQVAQWHNMGSAVLPPITLDAMARNMRWDGYFHAGTLALTLIGIVLLWREGRNGTAPATGRMLAGQLLLGWGIFNLVEGVIDHHVLELHHVRDMPMHVPLYDWLFIGVGGIVFIAVGWLMIRRTAQ